MLPNILIGILFVWSAVISFFLFRTLGHYNRLVKRADKKNLKEILETLLKNQEINSQEIKKIIAKCEKIENNALLHFQKSNILRYNPFSDTGSNQSFVLVLLDGINNGLILSSLHGRNHSRWYVKTIKAGKAVEHELSAEEQKALNETLIRKK